MKVVMPMIFLSTLLRQSIYDIEGRRLGVLRDISVSLNETFPVVTALVVRSPLGNSQNDMIIPWYQVNSLEEPQIHLVVKQPQIASYTPQSDELLLKRDILDKQIVDTQGFRVVKVNDLKLAQIKKTARLVGVDISLSGLLRRLGIQPAFNALSRVMPFQLAERTITWNYVEPIQMVRAGGTTGQLTPALAAAGIMTSEVLSLSLDATVDEALAYLRQHSSHLEMIYYLYIVDEEHRLRGVVSLRQLVTAEPSARMQSLMNPDVIKVQVDTDQEEVARII